MTTETPDPGEPALPPPDGKDWTWVLERMCPACGFDAATVTGPEVAAALEDVIARWELVLARPNVRQRPQPATWSPLEYGCHVRDVFALFDERTRLLLRESGARFDNWDQDATAVQRRYWQQDPREVARELAEAGHRHAETLAGVAAEDWARTGRRSNGSAFTVDSLARYMLHDVVHHLHDVAG